ncbi:MAG: PAS domain S-box protein [Bdellovibrionaceae bacterium]|nr:PAS domain S-box protein [Bdellovibrionales bacterium]MCB9084022.1 PAS domain S-box protein [Pseudobdellovibrionaceae bacterium]
MNQEIPQIEKTNGEKVESKPSGGNRPLLIIFFTMALANILILAGSLYFNHEILHSLADVSNRNSSEFEQRRSQAQATAERLGAYESLQGLAAILLLTGMMVAGYVLALRVRRKEGEIKTAKWQARRFRRTLDQAAIITTTDLHGRITDANQAFEKISGFSRDEVIGKNHRIINSDYHPPSFWQNFWNTLKAGQVFQGEVCNRAKDGSIYWVETQVIPQKDSLGNVVEYIAIRHDITERKLAEEKTQHHRAVIDSIGQIQRSFLEGGSARETFDYLLSVLLRATGSEYGYIGEVFYSGDKPFLKTHAITDISWNEETKALLTAKEEYGLEFHNMDTLFGHVITNNEFVIANDPAQDERAGGIPPGHPPLNAYLGIPIRFGDELVGSIGVANREGGYDMALVDEIHPYLEACALVIHALRERRAIEKAHRMLEDAQASAKMGSYSFDVENNKITWSRQMYQVFDFDLDATGTAPSLTEIHSRVHPEDVAIYDKAFEVGMETGAFQVVEFRILRRNGQVAYIHSRAGATFSRNGKLLTLQGTCQDITDVREMEARLEQEKNRLIQAAKMATLGEMASGVAHEINNPLAIIRGFSDQLLALAGKGTLDIDKVTDSSEKIGNQVMRIKKIVDGLRTFARDGEGDRMKEVPANKVVEETLELCRTRFASHEVELRVKLAEHSPTLSCREVQISQVLLNLLSNAHDAVLDSGVPERWVEISCVDDGDTVEFRVRDSGPGVSTEHRYLIFQPFFTTKEVGAGSGLGLSISKGIAESHKGTLYYDGTSGQNAFVLSLPKDPTQVEKAAKTAA